MLTNDDKAIDCTSYCWGLLSFFITLRYYYQVHFKIYVHTENIYHQLREISIFSELKTAYIKIVCVKWGDMESSLKRRTNTSRRKLQSVNNMSSLTSMGFHKAASCMPFRSSTSLTLYNLMSTDPKLAALASMADYVTNYRAFVSTFITS